MSAALGVGASESNRKSVLFVCLGNICRSPLAEGVFRHLIRNRRDRHEWKVDSCATADYHTGEQPDPRCLKTLQLNGINNYEHTVRKITKEDFRNFHFIFGMDANNMEALNKMKPADFKGTLCLLGRYDASNPTGFVRDPYYDVDDDNKGFRLVYDLSKKSCLGFLEQEGFESSST